MTRVSDVVRDVVESSALFQFGLLHRLINLSRLAQFIHPAVEARTQKKVQVSAIHMALSRLGKSYLAEEPPISEGFAIKSLEKQSALAIFTLERTMESRFALNSLHEMVMKNNDYITITQGLSEVTLIVDAKYDANAVALFGQFSCTRVPDVAAISIRFESIYQQRPGFLYSLLRLVSQRGINVIEVASTGTEFILYLHERDLALAFDSLSHIFFPESELLKAAVG